MIKSIKHKSKILYTQTVMGESCVLCILAVSSVCVCVFLCAYGSISACVCLNLQIAFPIALIMAGSEETDAVSLKLTVMSNTPEDRFSALKIIPGKIYGIKLLIMIFVSSLKEQSLLWFYVATLFFFFLSLYLQVILLIPKKTLLKKNAF